MPEANSLLTGLCETDTPRAAASSISSSSSHTAGSITLKVENTSSSANNGWVSASRVEFHTSSRPSSSAEAVVLKSRT